MALIEFFQDLAADEFLFLRCDGQRWKKSDQTRPFKGALSAAALPGNGSIYALRHTYISFAIEGGVPRTVIAKNCWTSVRRSKRRMRSY